MKKIYFLLFTILMTSLSFGQDLLISGIYDGPLPGGDPKGIELYVVNDIADLSTYGLEIAGNGGASTGEEWQFPADSYTAGDFIYVTNGDGVDFAQYFGISATYVSTPNSVVSHNGDDTIILWSGDGTTIIDSIGEIGVDGSGTAWESLDGWGYRIDGMGPNATFDAAEWTFSGPNALDGCDLGDDSGTNAGCASVYPIGTYSPTASTLTEITITSPGDMAVLAAGTTDIDINYTTMNLNAGDQVDFTVTKNAGAPATTTDVMSNPFTIMGAADGDAYEVTAEITNGGSQVDFETINFSISFPCDLVIGSITTTCDAVTNMVDMYTTTIDFTGGGTSTYAIDTGGVGVVDLSGGNPSTDASGQIVITNVLEGTNFSINFLGDVANSSCDIDRNINSPACIPAVCAAVGSIIVTEIFNDATGSDTDKEWFEVYNTTGSSIDMQGWTLTDDGSNSHTITSSLVVASGAYVVLGQSTDMGVNGGVNVSYAYSGFTLANGDDEVVISCEGTEIERVNYDGGPNFPDGPGVSMELSTNHLNATDNDNGAAWCSATNDFGGGLGTPGTVNDCSATLSIDQFNANNFSIYPNPVSNGFVTIVSSNTDVIKVAVYDILGKQVKNETLSNNTLDVSNLNTGIYIMKISQNNASVTKKLVIK